MKTEDGKLIIQKTFGKNVNLTVSGQLNGEAYAMAFRNIYIWTNFPCRELKHNTPCSRVLDDRT